MRKKTFPREILWNLLKPMGGVQRMRFDSSRCYFQYAIPGLKLGIEIDSGLIGRINFTKYNKAQVVGWHILRFTEHEIRCGIAASMIDEFLHRRIEWKKGKN
ncbi:MAG: hypothetical protein WC998_09120 [Candidatus Paceibacterota bacterium]|jgi:hypothetical protein